jgi:hypothetical protein
MPQLFNRALNANEVLAGLSNMIIAIQTFADNISETKSTLINMMRVDAGPYGDQKLYVSVDILKTYDWQNDREAANLLQLHRPPQPKVQSLAVNRFRMVPLTVDYYMTKRAWMEEGSFATFTSTMLTMMSDTRRVFEATTYNTFVGTTESLEGKQVVNVALPSEPDGTSDVEIEAYNRLTAQIIAKKLSELLMDVEDINRDYNDFGFLRSYNVNNLVFVWNHDWVSKITKLDLPTIFHKDDLVERLAEHTLPARYFGNVNASSGTTGAANTTIRSLIEKDYNTVDMNNPAYNPALHVFPGDLLPGNTPYGENETYGENPNIICKVMHKNGAPMLNGFSAGTEFYNPRSLTNTSYMIWSYSDPEYLMQYPFITIKAQVAE